MAITGLTSSDNFKTWFNKTNEIITQVNTQEISGVTGITGGNGIGVSYENGYNLVYIKNTVTNGITFTSNVRIQGNAIVDGTLSAGSLTVNKTTISYSPLVSGLTSGNVVRIDPTVGLTFAMANNADNAEVLGIVVAQDSTNNATLVAIGGKIDNSSFSSTIGNALKISGGTLGYGSAYFLSPTLPGGITTIEPTTYGHVSRPVLLGITGTEGVLLPYRGIVIDGITAGITAELDNKIIIEVDYNTPTYGTKQETPSLGDPVYYFGELDGTGTNLSNVSDVSGLLGTSSNFKVIGASNDNTVANVIILSYASSLSLRNYCIGAVSGVISDSGTSMILEVVTRGGNFNLKYSDLDSDIYNKALGLTGGNYKLNTSTNKFEPQAATATATNTSWATIIKNNDAENTVRFILNHTEFDTGGGVSSLLPTTPSISGSTAGITLINSNNLLVNGSFNVWQRGEISYTSANLSSLSTYFTPITDRWFASTNGCTGITLSVYRQEFDSNQIEVLGSPTYWMTWENQYTLKDPSKLAQRPKFENFQRGARLLQGQTATVSFYAKAGLSGATLDVFYNRYNSSYAGVTGLTAAIEARTLVSGSGIQLLADWKQYSATFKVNSGITLSAGEEGWFSVGFEFPNTTDYNISQVRLNLGEYPTAPIYVEYDKELVECQRYYQKSYSKNKYEGDSTDNNMNDAVLDLFNLSSMSEYMIKFPIKMNTAPDYVRIYSWASGVSGEAYNASSGQDMRNSNGTIINVPWTITSPYRSNSKISGNINVNQLVPEGFSVIISGGAYSGDRIKFHWIADADVDKLII
jgi:hypothetical protein